MIDKFDSFDDKELLMEYFRTIREDKHDPINFLTRITLEELEKEILWRMAHNKNRTY